MAFFLGATRVVVFVRLNLEVGADVAGDKKEQRHMDSGKPERTCSVRGTA